MRRKAVVFDMDGTLVDSRNLAVAAAYDGLREYYQRRGVAPVLPAAAEIGNAIGLPSLAYFVALLPPEREADAAELRRYVVEREVHRLAGGEGRLFPRALEVLAGLRSAGWALALVSNCGREYFDGNLRHLGLRGEFEVCLCLDDGPDKKTNVRAALRRLDAGGGLMVGDRAADIEAGRCAGLMTVACRFGFGASGELAGADHAIDSLCDLLALVETLS